MAVAAPTDNILNSLARQTLLHCQMTCDNKKTRFDDEAIPSKFIPVVCIRSKMQSKMPEVLHLYRMYTVKAFISPC